MKLYHFSSKLPATGGTVDPKKLGANSWSVAEKRALSTPRSFFYTHPKHREALFTTASPLFEADVADNKIYDFDKDEHAIKQPGTTLSHMIAKVRRKGYHGVMYFGGRVVAMFTPVRVKASKVKLAREDVVAHGREYHATHKDKFGLDRDFDSPGPKWDPELSKRTAAAFERAKHLPDHPKVKAAYDQLAKEIEAQHAFLVSKGVRFTPWTKEGQPYANSKEMQADVHANGHLYYFPSEKGQGQGEVAKPSLSPEINDKFRAVHDYFGHAMNGHQFGPKGELQAWGDHAKMFSPLARAALTTETHGQNSWVNFGPESHRPVTERPYAPQKATLLPKNVIPLSRFGFRPPPDIKRPANARHVYAWITPKGEVHHIPDSHHHEDVARKHGFSGTAHAQQNGWLRVSSAGAVLDGANYVVPPNLAQLRALKDLAIGAQYDQASVNDRPLRLAWKPVKGSQPQGWISPTGVYHENPDPQGVNQHEPAIKALGFRDGEHAFSEGWTHIAKNFHGNDVHLHHPQYQYNHSQINTLKRLAKKYDLEPHVSTVSNGRPFARPLRLARSLVYVSPSMREGSTMAQALASFKSPEHAALNAEAQRLGGDPVPAMGTWTDGAEESSVVKAPSGRARIIAALLGKKFQQKAVGLFTPGPGGDTLHLVYLKGYTPESADAKLRQHGIEYATHVPVKNGVITHLIGAPEASVAALGAPFRKITGTAEFPGADTRDEAIRVYDSMLKMARELPEPSGNIRTPGNSYKATFNSGDNTYTARMAPLYHGSPNHSFDFYQHDTPDECGITGAGNAMQTFSHVAAHFIHGLRTLKPKRVYFSAKEPSRIKLYAALVKRLPKYAPEYVARPSTVKGGWFVEPKEDPEVQLARPQPFSEVTKALLPQAGDPDARGILADHLEELGDPLYHVFRGEESPYGHTRGRQVFTGRTNNMYFALYRIPGDSKNIAASVNYGPDENGWHHTHVPVEAAKDIVRHHFGNVVSKDTTATAREMRATMGMDYPSYKKTKADQVREVMKLARDYDPEAPHPAEGWIEEDGTHHANEPGVYGDRHLRTLHRLGYKNHGEAVRAGLMHVAADDGQLLGHRSDRKYTAPQLITLKKLAAKNKTEPAITTTQNGIVTTRVLRLARPQGPTETEKVLWPHLHDSAARAVLADHLEEMGDPLYHVLREGQVNRDPLADDSLFSGFIDPSNNSRPFLHIAKGRVYSNGFGAKRPPQSYAVTVFPMRQEEHSPLTAFLDKDKVKDIIKHHYGNIVKSTVPVRELGLASYKKDKTREARKTLALARSKAPSGGMIVNNQFYEGGKFLPRVFQSIKRVRDAKRAKVKLSRETEAALWSQAATDPVARAVLADYLEERGDPLHHVLRGAPVDFEENTDFMPDRVFWAGTTHPAIKRMEIGQYQDNPDKYSVALVGHDRHDLHVSHVNKDQLLDILKQHHKKDRSRTYDADGIRSIRSIQGKPVHPGRQWLNYPPPVSPVTPESR